MLTNPSLMRDVLRGLSRAWAMAIGYVVIGFSVAASAYAVGVSPANILGMQTLVYAATSQLIATNLMASGAGMLAIIATTFIVNLRHLLMASALAPHLKQLGRWQLALFTFFLCDESFALHAATAATGRVQSRVELLTVNITLHIAGLLGAIAAVALQMDAGVLRQWGLDYAPTAMFIALLALLSRNALQRIIMTGCGLLSVALARLGVGPESVLISTLVGASLGTWIEGRKAAAAVAEGAAVSRQKASTGVQKDVAA